ncbi:hypothetical protein FIU94_00095 [Sulfitobacter sp. THAF37]|uniref:hypothetical protein n=1 Tax=Sulfitobacter sp. THAF37 TaxID=2587855 RepID=UPI0012684048|nr:hypothetical protein [Sulfitobacter sp. THAF37]QFT57206.1 hypothetical protein FIU94_00095 [Sulfitobacter sp. THAF37]
MTVRLLVAISFLLLLVARPLLGQDDPTNIIRVCAPSTNLAAKLEGAVGNVISRRLLGAEASGSVEVFQDGELLQMMIAADPQNATVIYRMYLDCVQPQIDRFVEARIASKAMSIGAGDSFSMQKGSTVSLLDEKYFFSVRGHRNSASGQFSKVQTTLKGLENRLSQLEIGDSVNLRKVGCQIIATGFDPTGPTYRFQLGCQ